MKTRERLRAACREAEQRLHGDQKVAEIAQFLQEVQDATTEERESEAFLRLFPHDFTAMRSLRRKPKGGAAGSDLLGLLGEDSKIRGDAQASRRILDLLDRHRVRQGTTRTVGPSIPPTGTPSPGA